MLPSTTELGGCDEREQLPARPLSHQHRDRRLVEAKRRTPAPTGESQGGQAREVGEMPDQRDTGFLDLHAVERCLRCILGAEARHRAGRQLERAGQQLRGLLGASLPAVANLDEGQTQTGQPGRDELGLTAAEGRQGPVVIGRSGRGLSVANENQDLPRFCVH